MSVPCSLIASIVNLSRKTFRRCPATKRFLLSPEEFGQHKEELRRMLHKLTADDLGLQHSTFLNGKRTQLGEEDSASICRRTTHHGDSSSSCCSSSSMTSSTSSSSTSSSASGALRSRTSGPSSSAFPLCYVSIFEDDCIAVGVFMVRPGRAIPLHNHPNMFGMLKCVAGTCDIRAYSEVDPEKTKNLQYPSYFTEGQRLLASEGEIFPVRKTILRGIDAKSAPCLLTPTELNYHEIRATSSTPVAFLDILAPPYSSEDTTLDVDEIRECTYFSEVLPCFSASSSSSEEEPETSSKDSSPVAAVKVGYAWLEDTPPPQNYDMMSEPYMGPRAV